MKKIIWISGITLLVLAIGFSFLYDGSTFGTGAIRKLVQKPTATTKKVTVTATKTTTDKTTNAKKTQTLSTDQLRNSAQTTPPVSTPAQTVSSIAVSLPPADPTNTELSKLNKRLDELFTLVKNIPAPVNQTTIYQPERQCPTPVPVAPAPESTPPTPQVSATKALDDSAVAYWKFEDQSSTAAEDSSGNGNAAPIFGTPTFTDGKAGKAVSLNGMNDYLQLNVPEKLSSPLAEFTIELWVFLNNSQDREYNCLVSLGATKTDTDYNDFLTKNLNLCIFNKGNAVLTFPRIENDPYYLITNNIGDISGGWHHLAIVYNNQNVYIYRDSVLVATRPATGLVALNSDFKIRMGGDVNYPASTLGKLDELRIFDKALTKEEILTIYNAEQ